MIPDIVGREVERRIMERLTTMDNVPDTPQARSNITTMIMEVLDQMEQEGHITFEQNVMLLSNSVRYINAQIDEMQNGSRKN